VSSGIGSSSRCRATASRPVFTRSARLSIARQAGLEIADDRLEKARREKTRPKGTGRILANGRQLSQSSSDRGGHAVKLPTGFLADRLRSVRCGPAGGRGGIRGGTQSVRAHMRDTGGRLPGRTGGGHRCGSCHLARGGAADETAADLPCDASSPRAKARVRAIPSRGRRSPVASASNNPQHPLRTIHRPSRDDPPVSFDQRLRRDHTRILARRLLGAQGEVESAPGPFHRMLRNTGTRDPEFAEFVADGHAFRRESQYANTPRVSLR